MRLRLSVLTSVVLAGATLWLVFECRRVAEVAGQFEIGARAAEQAAGEAHQQAASLLAERDGLLAEKEDLRRNVARLEGELGAAQAQRTAMAEVLEQHAQREQERAAAAAAAAAAQARPPMPEGVRQCLAALHECLRAEGFASHRLLYAARLDGDGLHDVELLETAADGLVVEVFQAGRMTAVLDRGKGRLQLRLFEGTRSEGSNRMPLPADGWPITFAPVDGPMFEARLPFLLRVEGVYPEAVAKVRPASDLDPTTRAQWLDRFDRLLAGAGTTEELRVNRCRGLQDGRFLGVQLIGSDSKHRLLLSADCARMAVEVDPTAGVVSLLLQDGALRRGGAESTITAEGYRMLLPKVTPKQATDVMLGMVVTK